LVVGLTATRIGEPRGPQVARSARGVADGDHDVIGEPALSQTIDECSPNGRAILRRTIHPPEGKRAASRFGVTVSPLTYGTNQLHGAVCLFTDLTAVQQLEEQLRLKQSLATVGELTAGIAHEFRNGLATIHGYGRLIDRGVAANFRPSRDPGRAISLGGSSQLPDFAKPAQLALSDIDLRMLCDRVADEARTDARALGDVTAGEFGQIQGDRCCCDRCSATCCAMRSRPAWRRHHPAGEAWSSTPAHVR
jgi:signal transduction histidine kinase